MPEKKYNKTSENIGMVGLLGPRSDSKEDAKAWKGREKCKQEAIWNALKEG